MYKSLQESVVDYISMMDEVIASGLLTTELGCRQISTAYNQANQLFVNKQFQINDDIYASRVTTYQSKI